MASLEDIREEYERMVRPEIIEIRFRISKYETFYLPDEDGEEEIIARFRPLSFDDHNTVYQMATKLIRDERAKDYVTITDYMNMKKLILKRQLIWWNIEDIPIEYDGEWIEEETFARVCSLPGPIISRLINEYEETTNITIEEEEIIKRQSTLLFSPTSSAGVNNPCEAVSLYCNLSRFWEKFGLNKFDLKSLSYREYLMLRLMSMNSDEAQRRASKAASTTSNVRVAGKGGKIRPSRGVRVGGH
jgi:hypothetical protein